MCIADYSLVVNMLASDFWNLKHWSLSGLSINKTHTTTVHYATVLLFALEIEPRLVISFPFFLFLFSNYHEIALDSFQSNFSLGAPFLLLKDSLALSCFKKKHSFAVPHFLIPARDSENSLYFYSQRKLALMSLKDNSASCWSANQFT